MKLLVWSALLCLACNNVCGMFFELPDNTAASADESTEDDIIGTAISGINQHFSNQGPSTNPKSPSRQKGSNSAGATTAATTSTGFLAEMETSLEHATDKLDEIWQQLRKGVFSLVDSSDNDDSQDTDRGNITQSNSLKQLQTTTNSIVAKATSTIHIPTTTTSIVTTTTRQTAPTTLQTPLP